MNKGRAPRDMLRVAFDMPADIPIGRFLELSHMLNAENLDMKRIGRIAGPGDAPTRANGATMKEVLLYHAHRHQKLQRQELISLLELSGFTRHSAATIINHAVEEKILKTVGRGEYAATKPALLPPPSKGK